MLRRVLLGLLVGAAGAVIGLLPWLITGARLPLQNLGTGAPVPVALLPFSQYGVVLLGALLITGSVVAGLASRAVGPSRVHRLVVAGALLSVQIGVIVQAALATGGVLQRSTASSRYLAVLVAVASLACGIGLLVHLLVALAPRPGALVGAAIAAVLVPSWIGVLLVPFGAFEVSPVAAALLPLLRWVPAVVVGVGIAWSGLRGVGRVVAALAGLVIIWIGPALVTAVASTSGSRVLLRDPRALVENTQAILAAAATTSEVVLPPLVLAVAIGLLGAGAHAFVRRRSRSKKMV